MAAGNRLAEYFPQGYEPTLTNYATYKPRNAHPMLEFSNTVDQSAMWSRPMPDFYDNGGALAYIFFGAELNAGIVDWDVCLERIGDQILDIDVDSFAAPQSANNCTVPAVSGKIHVVTIAFTDGAQMDGIQAGEAYRIKITRGATGETGGTAGKAQLLMMVLQETP